MSVSHEEVRRMAALARLIVDEARIPALADELNGILRHMEVLQQVPAESAPDASIGADSHPAAWRPDLGESSPPDCNRAAFAPAMRDGFFLVPRLATHEVAGASDDASAHT